MYHDIFKCKLSGYGDVQVCDTKTLIDLVETFIDFNHVIMLD